MEVQKEPSNPGGEPANFLPSFFLQETSTHRNRSRKFRTPEIVDRLHSTTSLDDSTTTAQFPLLNGIERSQKYFSIPSPGDGRFTILLHNVSEDGDWPSRLSTPSEAWSLSQTLYHLDTGMQGLARFESSSLHLRGVELIYCDLKITRPCWTRLATLLMNFFCLSLLLRPHRHPKHLPL